MFADEQRVQHRQADPVVVVEPGEVHARCVGVERQKRGVGLRVDFDLRVSVTIGDR